MTSRSHVWNPHLNYDQLAAVCFHLAALPDVRVNADDDLFVCMENEQLVAITVQTYASGPNDHAIDVIYEYLADRMCHPTMDFGDDLEQPDLNLLPQTRFIIVAADQLRRIFHLNAWRDTLTPDLQMKAISELGISFSFEDEDEVEEDDTLGEALASVSGFPELTGGVHVYGYYKRGEVAARSECLENIIFQVCDRRHFNGLWRELCCKIDGGSVYYPEAPTSDFVQIDASSGYRIIPGLDFEGVMTNDPKRQVDEYVATDI